MRNPTNVENSIILEGNTRLMLPELVRSRGPSSADMQVFYNPAMSLSRDFSVLFFSMEHGIERALDGLAATGARGIRIMNESEFRGEMHLNDHSPTAVDLMERNAALNGVEVEIHRSKLNTLLSSRFFDYIDIDPFGSPVDFIPQAFQSVRNGGIIAVTATDTGALCGSYPKACLRRYGYTNRRNPLCHETGIRGLLGYLVRQAAVQDRFIEPLVSHSINHFYRVLIRVHNGARKADRALEALSYLGITSAGFRVGNPPATDASRTNLPLGPFYAGPLHDPGCVQGMIRNIEDLTLHTRRTIPKLLMRYADELDFRAWFFDSDRVSSFLKRSSPPLTSIIMELRDQGFSASQTQFSPTGFKTDADETTVLDVISNM